MSERLLAFLNRWRHEVNKAGPLASWSREARLHATAVLRSESLAEAHRLAAECIAEIRKTDHELADRIRRETFGGTR